MKTVLAFDFGASSGRAIKASFDGEKIVSQEIHRFENIPVTIDGHMCHDVPMIVGEVKAALQKAGQIDAFAFDTWGVDYALIGADGKMLHMPFHYRDERTKDIADTVFAKISREELYRETGNQIMNINTLFQLLVDENRGSAESLLMMPDLFAYLFSGNRVCEYSIASTTQMFNPVAGQWSETILQRFGISETLFPRLVPSASITGEAEAYGGAKIVSIAGHDTQCAVAAMPCHSQENEAFLSCGTWSLIGCELDAPVLTEESSRMGLSNELGANNKINFLKNISGLWVIQEIRRSLAKTDRKYSYNELEMMARDSEPFLCFIDPDNEMFASPENLPDKIRAYCSQTGQTVPETTGALVRCVYESLALKYRYALEQISRCTGKTFALLHMLGGGTKDGFLCELTADSLGIPVEAGPVEATALGNIILQLIALGEVKDVEEGRRIIARTETVKTYMPAHTHGWQEAYERFVSVNFGSNDTI